MTSSVDSVEKLRVETRDQRQVAENRQQRHKTKMKITARRKENQANPYLDLLEINHA